MTRTVNGKSRNKSRFPDYHNKTCHYLDALYATLVQLRPRYCLEIGTHDGCNSTLVFHEYFKNLMHDGHLITLDVVPCKNLPSKYVTQCIVNPHHVNVVHTCGGDGRWFKESDLKSTFKNDIRSSVTTNAAIVRDHMKVLQIDSLDFAFIDGDHERSSFLNDITICESLLTMPKFMMLDDTKEEFHQCCNVYHDEILTSRTYGHYDYDDWSRFVGCSLIWIKQ